MQFGVVWMNLESSTLCNIKSVLGSIVLLLNDLNQRQKQYGGTNWLLILTECIAFLSVIIKLSGWIAGGHVCLFLCKTKHIWSIYNFYLEKNALLKLITFTSILPWWKTIIFIWEFFVWDVKSRSRVSVFHTEHIKELDVNIGVEHRTCVHPYPPAFLLSHPISRVSNMTLNGIHG